MGRNILVVEDDKNISDLIHMYLVKEGFDVRIAGDGGKALEEFQKKEPDLILLDGAAGSPEELLKRAEDALYRATLGKTRLAYVPDADEAELQALGEDGWRCLTPSLDRAHYKLESSSNASALMKRVSARRGDVSVWLGTTASAAGLREFVISAQGAGHYCRAMTEIG